MRLAVQKLFPILHNRIINNERIMTVIERF